MSIDLAKSTWGIFRYGAASGADQYVAGDLTGDGRDDLAWVASDGTWRISADLGRTTWTTLRYGDAAHAYRYLVARPTGR